MLVATIGAFKTSKTRAKRNVNPNPAEKRVRRSKIAENTVRDTKCWRRRCEDVISCETIPYSYLSADTGRDHTMSGKLYDQEVPPAAVAKASPEARVRS